MEFYHYVGSFVMMLFSKKLFDEGMSILENNNYKLTNYHDSHLNWRLLKGYELSGNVKNCIDFANELVNQAHSNSPILHPLSMDALIGASCKLKQTREVLNYYKLAKESGIHLESSSVEKIVRYIVGSDDWKKVYDELKKRLDGLDQDEYVFEDNVHF